MTNNTKKVLSLSLIALLGLSLTGCAGDFAPPNPDKNVKTNSGATLQNATVHLDSKGMTPEQANIAERIERDSKPGTTKFLYIFSAYNNSLMVFSTVRGKVTSTTKRLRPSTVVGTDGEYIGEESQGIKFTVGNQIKRTTEVAGEDGTFGPSVPGIFWFTPAGEYYQVYPTGGTLMVISEKPQRVPPAVIQLTSSATAGQ